MSTLVVSDDDLCAAIARSWKERGYPPSVRELADQFHLALSTVHHRLADLQTAGRVTRSPYQPRTLRVVPPKRSGDVLIEVVLAFDNYQDAEAAFLEEYVRGALAGLPGVRVQSTAVGRIS